MKKKKSMFSILGVLLLSFTVVSGASAGYKPYIPIPIDGDGSVKPKPSCVINGYCPLP